MWVYMQKMELRYWWEYDDASLLTLYDGQLTSSTQLLALNYLVILSHRRSATVSSKTYPLYLLKIIDV